jgi:hypothetical protein
VNPPDYIVLRNAIFRSLSTVSGETLLASSSTSIAKQLERQYPDSNHRQGAAVTPLSDAA